MARIASARECTVAVAVAAWVALGSTGCPENTKALLPPVADAGVGQVVQVGAIATLDGSGSRSADSDSAEGLEFDWEIVSRPAGSVSGLSNETFERPEILIDAAGDFLFKLVVTENDITSRPAVVVVRGFASLDVVEQTPPSGAWGVALEAPVVVRFSEPIQPESLGSTGLRVIHAGAPLPGTLETMDGNAVAVFRPREPYPPDALLTVDVARTVVSIGGFGLPARYQGTFVTARGADNLGPGVWRITPADGATGVAPSVAVVIDFDEAVDEASATTDSDVDGCSDTIFLATAGSPCIAGSVEISAAGTRATLTPSIPLTGGSAYDLTILGGASGIRDLAGNRMAATETAGFSVSTAGDSTPPRVLSIYPGHTYDEVPLGITIVITFSEPLEPGSVGIDTAQLVAPAGGITVTRTLEAGNRVLTLSPRSLLAPGTEFTVTLRGQGGTVVTDRAGLALDGDGDGIAGGNFQARFTTTSRPTRDGSFDIQADVKPGETILVSLNDRDEDTSGAPDTVIVTAVSTTGESESIVLVETLGTSGIFEGSVRTRYATVAGTDDDGVFNAEEKNVITFTYEDALSSAGVPQLVEATVDVLKSDAGFTVEAISGNTDEGGATATFRFWLNAEPTANVTVNFDSNDSSEGTVSVTSLSFSTTNYNVPQTVTVTGADDDVVDGDQPYAIVFSAATSADENYAALTPPDDIPVTNIDDDVAGFDVSAIGGDTTEGLGTATFTIALTSEPVADVSIDFDSDNPEEGTVNPTTASFTAATWDLPVTVTVTGVDEDIDDGDQVYNVTFQDAISTDGLYSGQRPADVQVTNVDDDVASFSVSPISNPTDEGGSSATFSVVLTSEPLGDVTLNLESSDTSEGVVSVSSLTFTAANWDTPQTVIVTGVDDDLADNEDNDSVPDGLVSYLVRFTSVTSTDPLYPSLTPSAVPVNNLDDDTADILVTSISGPTTETGGTATFAVSVTSRPAALVQILFPSSTNTNEGTVPSTTIAIDPATWDVPRVVTVTGQNGAPGGGPISYSILLNTAASGDPLYVVDPWDVLITNEDFGATGVPALPTSAFTLGTTLLVRVRADTDPSVNATSGAGNDTVTVTVASAAAGDTEGMTLNENALFAGWFDCHGDGCLLATAAGGAVAGNGILEADPAGDTITLTYVDAVDAAGSTNVPLTAVAAAAPADPCTTGIKINEVVTAPQTDWNDTVGGDATLFNDTPGTGLVDRNDEWIELVNTSAGACDLTGMLLHMLDGSDYTYELGVTNDGQTLVFSAGGSITSFGAGEYLVIGDPSGSDSMEDDIWVRLDEQAGGGVVDEVALGSSLAGDSSSANNAPAGTSTGQADEACARATDGVDTDADDADWATRSATIGAANP